ncbi:GPW/gp25 family protein [Pseudomonas sp. HR96]|uniref:GPW/gp25 family protein n=1 Tax=Pseudomonas sp. HR96 TaxID=1027966 RepID=UPI002A763B96|nr:GPW/gp25 family protein [Pseudomonas sp. HR96]WPO98636.1 GPW/gp25 family protein [Pseudomonas sp. HR96]
MKPDNSGVLGRGWAFPVAFSVAQGAKMAVDLADIEQSLRIIFSTQAGERVMRPEFGSDLTPLMFENVTDGLVSRLTARITESVERDEPRVLVSSVQVQQDPNRPSLLKVRVQYRVRNADFEGALNWDLDLNEGLARRHI